MNASVRIVVEQTIAELSGRSVFTKEDTEYRVRTLHPVQSWQPHADASGAPGSVVVGEDPCGNLFLKAPDGSVSFWDHETNTEMFLAASVESFCGSLTQGEPVKLKPGQVLKAWINPKFLTDQKSKGNA